MAVVGVVAGCGSSGGDGVSTGAGTDPGGSSAEGASTASETFPIEGGTASRVVVDGKGALFVSGGLEPGSNATPPEGRGSAVVYRIDAGSKVTGTWDLGLPPERHLFGGGVASVGDELVVVGAECDVLVGSENPGACTGGAPRMWRLLAEGKVEAIPLPDEFARYEVGGDVSAGYLTPLGEVDGRLAISLQTAAFVDARTAVGSIYAIDPASGDAQQVDLPSTLLALGQLCVRPSGGLVFGSPVLADDGLSYSAIQLYDGVASPDGVRWQESGRFEVERSTDTNPRLACSDDMAAAWMPSTSDTYVVGAGGELVDHAKEEDRQLVEVVALDDALYRTVREPNGQGSIATFDRIRDGGAMDTVAETEIPPGELPIIAEVEGTLFNAGSLVALGRAADAPAPSLTAL